jgi:hypothetical protein
MFSNTFKSSDYKNELDRLISKSQGTAYEATLKRFVQSKYKELENSKIKEENEIEQHENLHKFNANRNYEQNSYIDYEANDNLSYSSSVSYCQSRKEKDKIEWLDEMSKPNERHTWKVKK